MKSGPVKCSGCCESESSSQKKQLFDNNDILWTHISVVHAAWIPFECVLCPLIMMPSDTVINQHYQQIHPGLIPKAIYTFDEEKKSLVMQLFLQSQNLSTTSADDRTSTDNSTAENGDIQTSNFVSLRQLQQLTVPRRTFETAYQTDVLEQERDVPDDNSVIIVDDSDHRVDNRQEILPQQPEMESPVSSAEAEEHVEIEPIVQALTAISSTGEVRKHRRVRIRNVVDCRLCERPFATNHTEHIWSRHVSKLRYACAFCSFATPKLDTIKRHARARHKNLWDAKQACWEDNTEALDEEYTAAYFDAFGRHFQGNHRTTKL